MVGFVCVRWWEKRNRSNVNWRVVKVCVGLYNMGLLKHFASLSIETFWAQDLWMFWTTASLYV